MTRTSSTLKPIERMWERVETARHDSDTSVFYDLLYFGELLTKLTVTAMVASMANERQRHRYRQLYRLVRADGLGEWATVLEEVLTGPPSTCLAAEARREQKELTQRVGRGTWQSDAVSLLTECLCTVVGEVAPSPTKVQGHQWFSLFVRLRNATRGHGATRSATCAQVSPLLENSLRRVLDNFCLLRRPWAYLSRNLAGNYRVTPWLETSAFDRLKSKSGGDFKLANGVHVVFDEPTRVELVESDVDASDFYFPNGGFNARRFEMLSYCTDQRTWADATPYNAPPGELPSSETQGDGTLRVHGEVFSNLPPVGRDYVKRPELESELFGVLTDERHPVVTLVGRGGIGKTSLAVAVLDSIAWGQRYGALVWFSARDVDLLPSGPKLVKRHVTSTREIADEFARLMEPAERAGSAFDAVAYCEANLHAGGIGPILFAFDNFETMRNPPEVFEWLDTHVRLPNKVLITTRHREFKGDYPVEVRGMSEDQARELVDRVAQALGIRALVTADYEEELLREADGHPYVIKILLGEVAKAGRRLKVERVAAAQDQILDALFDRTFERLSEAARRVFLTVCNWRSAVPELALEAVLLRPENEKFDVRQALEELQLMSLVQLVGSEKDEELFVTVPLAAQVFGKRKLAVSAMKSAVQADTDLLHAFGAVASLGVRDGVRPRIERLFQTAASRAGKDLKRLQRFLPILEFTARRFPPAWLLLGQLFEESGSPEQLEKAKECVRQYLQSSPSQAEAAKAWKKLATLHALTGDWIGEMHARVELAELEDIDFEEVSASANRLNSILRAHPRQLDSQERKALFTRLARAMERRIDKGDATDCSRLAWLFLNLGNQREAREYAERGLRLERQNDHCQRLIDRLTT